LAKIILMIGLIILLYFSFTWRVEKYAQMKNYELPVEPRISPFSQAIMDLLATAGGVYLALLLVQNFLQITIPTHITIYGYEFEPLAALSLVIAVFQPYFNMLVRRQ